MNGRLQVRNLANTATEDELRTLFTQVGDVLDVRIIRDVLSGMSKGYGFVTMSALSEADRAVSRLDQFAFHGLELKVRLAGPGRTLDAAQPPQSRQREES